MAVRYNIIFFVATLFFNNVSSQLLYDTTEPQPNIVNGVDTTIDACPHTLSCKMNIADGSGYYFCGAILISDTCAITAAHCCAVMDKNNLSLIELRGGSNIVNGGTRFMVKSFTIHPEYNNSQFNNDVCCMKFETRIENFNETLQPLTMPCRKRGFDCKKMTIAGWGAEFTGGPAPQNTLQIADVPCVNPFVCFLTYPLTLTENMCCGGNVLFGNSGTCQGDSGGAAFETIGTPSGVVRCGVGITSFGRGCGQALSPSVFARLSSDSILDFVINCCNMTEGTACCNKNDLGHF